MAVMPTTTTYSGKRSTTDSSTSYTMIGHPSRLQGLSLEGTHHHQGHVIMLRGIAGKSGSSLEQVLQQFLCRGAPRRLDGLQQSFLTPLFVIYVHGLADAVGKRHQNVAGTQLHSTLQVLGILQETNHRTSRFQANEGI